MTSLDQPAFQKRTGVGGRVTGLKVSLSPDEGTTLPPEVFEMRHLESLECVYGGLTALPPEIGQLTNLKRLILTGNRLASLPAEIDQLFRLEELDLMDNELVEIPSGIRARRRLDLRGNRLASLPAWTFPPTEGTLDLADNELADLPTKGGWIEFLTELDVSGNRLREIPAKALLSHGESELSGRWLRRFLAWRGRESSLEVLILRENRLTRLPPELGYFQKLRHLDLRMNRLHELPRELGRAPALERIEVGHNPIERIPRRLRPTVFPHRSRLWYWTWPLRRRRQSGPGRVGDLTEEGSSLEPSFLVVAEWPGSGILEYLQQPQVYDEVDHCELALPRDLRRRFRAWCYEYQFTATDVDEAFDYEGHNQRGRVLARDLNAHLAQHFERPVRVSFLPAAPGGEGESEEIL